MSAAAELEAGRAASTGSVGMWVFLVSDLFSFFALLVSYGVLRLRSPGWAAGGEPSLLIGAALLLTGVLAASSVTYALAQRAHTGRPSTASEGQGRGKTTLWLLLTLLLGAGFLVGQLIEYRLLWRAGLTLRSGLSGASFYLITGFHGLHVLAGVALIGGLLWRSMRGKLDAPSLAVCGLYWHFVDGVWTGIVAAVYLASWPGLLLALAGLGLFFAVQLRRAPSRLRLAVLLPLALPALYSLGLLYEAWSRALPSHASPGVGG